MTKEYDAFVDNPERFQSGEIEVTLLIRELTPENRREKYGSKRVKAVVSPNPEGKATLSLRYQRGYLYPKKFGIEIIEEFPL